MGKLWQKNCALVVVCEGIAHLGVVAYLLEHNYEIEGIAGTSAGGMFGGPLAAQVTPHEIFNHVVDF